ncbi:MAG TPA: hypothetical protein VLN90_04145 [Thioalkalivibrio sp.]|nr:hypothetical protein [Thioalkalivibrio sp.]
MKKFQPGPLMHRASHGLGLRIPNDKWVIAVSVSAAVFICVLLWLAWSSGYWIILLLIVPAAGFALRVILNWHDEYDRKRGDDLFFDSRR